ncbi:MAG: hypothetical protein NVSMB1_21490 [Polyangiales bacterium]
MFPEATLPKRIGEYQVLQRLTSQGGAEIYLARADGPMGFSRNVVLKLVAHDATQTDPQRALELAREARISSLLNHPSIVRVYDFFEERDRLVLVLEYVEGVSLQVLLDDLEARHQRLSDRAACYVAMCITSALACAHAMTNESGAQTPVLHRALSPKKVLIARNAVAKLTGFGLGKILDRTPDSAFGLMKGLSAYTAPEQVRGERVDARADVYAAGVLCYHLFSGKRPLQSEDPAQRMIGKLESISALRPDVPREVAAAIDAAIEIDVDQRTISCAELGGWIAKSTSISAGRDELRAHVQSYLSSHPSVSLSASSANSSAAPAAAPAASDASLSLIDQGGQPPPSPSPGKQEAALTALLASAAPKPASEVRPRPLRGVTMIGIGKDFAAPFAGPSQLKSVD